MIVVVAKDYQKFEGWMRDNFKYVGDSFDLEGIDPADVDKIVFVEPDFRDHPIYFSDELLQFQFKVAENKFTKSNSLVTRLRRKLRV